MPIEGDHGRVRGYQLRLLAILALLALLAPAALAAPARVVEAHAPSRSGPARRLTVILPPAYDAASTRRYPVLYLFDGQNLVTHPTHAGGWRAADALTSAVQSGQAEPMIIVGLHAGDRLHEYTPVHDPARGGGGAPQLLDYVTQELVPHIDATYRTKQSAAHRALGGSSLGGLAALHGLVAHPKVFRSGLILSPSVWWKNKAILGEVAGSTSIARQRVMLYNGGDSDGRQDSEELRDLLHAKGLVFDRSLFHWTEPQAGHDEGAWASFLPRALSTIFPAR